MFATFDDTARRAVQGALAYARRDRAPEIGTEHLFRALCDDRDVVRLTGLDVAGLQQVSDEIDRAHRTAGLSPVDADALAAIGVDLDAIVEQVESELGAGALAARRRGRRRRLRTPMTQECRAALAAAARHASLRRDPRLRADHLLLGLVTGRDVVSDVLGAAGVTVPSVLAALDREERQAG